MKVLVTNDDGIYSPGIEAAVRALPDGWSVTMVAPSSQKSGIGRAISLFEPLRINELSGFGVPAFSVGGTPTDSVILGLHRILDDRPDLLVSGINLGENLSTEAVTTSGTIGAALEAATQGVPAISVSVQLLDEGDKFHEGGIDIDLGFAVEILGRLVRGVRRNGFPEGVDVLNVNIPASADAGTPMRVTRLGRRVFDTSVEERFDPRGKQYYWIDGGYITDVEGGTDVDTVLNEQEISITPITLEMTSDVDLSIEDLMAD
ncbi:5'/3'-nucleotidase SurE [Methanonatronarchaeum sp. AMET6-2]|uniref:5'/3'-nucleotidase SurE n=1 Tax=Methanonatronarchaeum sp. AMET6-2 TaxID=2933293 RepID=UPI0011FAC913|nr:5'/3'-nucleotidase SurE [Methanonatronarchaeum sp. AMET6-2]RZN61269.1 MAG: 5'/3'-nucleotidase SurE [Methanonatronarchaeia archaeon]UOY10246.1 5'/3'-nucleotidase SurE [Methanonatronarchaeum sp. AMET6-2]